MAGLWPVPSLNYYGGPFHTKRNAYTVQEAARLLVDTCSDEWLADMEEAFQYDKRDPEAKLTREQILDSPGIKTRLPRAPR